MALQKDAPEGGSRRPDSPPLRGGGKAYSSPVRPHRRMVWKWRQEGDTCPEIAAKLAAKGVATSVGALKKFLAREAKRRSAKATPLPNLAPEHPAPDTRAVQIMDPKKLVLNVTRPTPQPPKPSPAPKPPLPDYLKPENQEWHADYKPKSTEAVSHDQKTPNI